MFCRRSNNSILSLNIPIEAAINQEAVATYKEREAKRQKLKEEQVGTNSIWMLQSQVYYIVCTSSHRRRENVQRVSS